MIGGETVKKIFFVLLGAWANSTLAFNVTGEPQSCTAAGACLAKNHSALRRGAAHRLDAFIAYVQKNFPRESKGEPQLLSYRKATLQELEHDESNAAKLGFKITNEWMKEAGYLNMLKGRMPSAEARLVRDNRMLEAHLLPAIEPAVWTALTQVPHYEKSWYNAPGSGGSPTDPGWIAWREANQKLDESIGTNPIWTEGKMSLSNEVKPEDLIGRAVAGIEDAKIPSTHPGSIDTKRGIAAGRILSIDSSKPNWAAEIITTEGRRARVKLKAGNGSWEKFYLLRPTKAALSEVPAY
jgi:hypothetical protein